jgi:hypothetical protein
VGAASPVVHRAVDRRDYGNLDVQNVHQDLLALTIDLVVAPGTEEVKTFRTDRFHECGTTSGKDDDSVLRVGTNLVKEIDELLVRMSVEHQDLAVRM